MAGLPWFSVCTDFPEHPKSVRLGKLVKNPLAFAYVIRLWAFCAEYQQDGRFLGDDAAAMLEETAAGWAGKPGVLLDALLHCGRPGECGFVEQIEGGFYVHEWVERNGAHLRKRERDNARPNAARRQRGAPPPPLADPARGPEETPRGVSAGEGEGERHREQILPPVGSVGGGHRARIGLGCPEGELLDHWRRVAWPKLSSDPCPEPDDRDVNRLRGLVKSPGTGAVKAAMDRAVVDAFWSQPGKLDLPTFLVNFGRFTARRAQPSGIASGPSFAEQIDSNRPEASKF